jgi:hypothetical protein
VSAKSSWISRAAVVATAGFAKVFAQLFAFTEQFTEQLGPPPPPATLGFRAAVRAAAAVGMRGVLLPGGGRSGR